MKVRTLLSTVAIVALSCSLASAQSRQQQQDENTRATQTPSQSAPSRAQQNAPATGNTQATQPAPSNTQSSQQQQQPQSTQAPASQAKQQQPSAQQQQQRSTQSPAPANQQQQGAQQQPSAQPQPQQQQQRSTQSPAPANQQQGTQTQQTQQRGQGQAAQPVATTPQQRTQIATTLSRSQSLSPVRVNFNVAVGVAVPSSVRLAVLPDTIVSIVPQYRGYRYFVTDTQIIIVEPSSLRIVEVLPSERGGRAATAPAQRKVQLSNEQRASIKKHTASKQRSTTTGSGTVKRYVIEEEVPREVELEEFDDVVVREVPSFRSYRYIRRDSDVIVVDPGSRRVLDIID